MQSQIFKKLKLTTLLTAFVVAGNWQIAMAGDSEIEWLGQAAKISYHVDAQAAAQGCELYVNEFAEAAQSYRGSHSSSIHVSLKTSLDAQIENVGAVAIVEEDSVEAFGTNHEKHRKGKRTLGFIDEFLAAYPERFNGQASINIDLEWDSFGKDFGKRDINEIAFFVDLTEGSGVKRLWLKKGSSFFENADFSKERYRYSTPATYGYGSISYLSTQSGSPLFAARARCASN